MGTHYYKVTYSSILNLLLRQFLPGKFIFYGRVLKSVTCVALVCKAADKIRIPLFSTPLE
jgi:hypothetical protein